MGDPFDRDWSSHSPDTLLTAPMRWRKPSMVRHPGDLFGDLASDEQIDRVFAVMALCPQHTFQVLTKRAERMQKYLTSSAQTFPDADRNDDICAAAFALNDELSEGKSEYVFLESQCYVQPDRWPLPNVWLGTSCERQQEADERIPLLLQTPAAIRFVSLEPLLGPIDLVTGGEVTEVGHINWLRGFGGSDPIIPGLDWVIVGGESGSGARPMHPDWPRSLRQQCEAAGVNFFFKQHGEWLSRADDDGQISYATHQCHTWGGAKVGGDGACYCVGKKAAGRLLDGKEYNGMPEVRS